MIFDLRLWFSHLTWLTHASLVLSITLAHSACVVLSSGMARIITLSFCVDDEFWTIELIQYQLDLFAI